MKKKGIALLCAFSLICANLYVFAEDANSVQEIEAQAEEILVEETTLEENIFFADEESQTDVPVLMSDVDGDNVQIVDKTELLNILEDAAIFTEDMLGDSYESFADVIFDAQAVAEDDDATEDSVLNAVDAVTEAIEEGKKTIRNNLYETLLNAKAVDIKLTTENTYATFKVVYDAAELVYWDVDKTVTEVYNACTALLEAMESLVSKADVVILSGNIKSDEAKSYYPDMNSDDLPNITYKYLPGGNPGLLAHDTENNKLLKGLINSGETWEVVFGNWNQHQITEIVFDLGEEAYISAVDVWESCRYNYVKIGLAEVYFSNDGVNYTFAGKTEETLSGEIAVLRKIPVEFETTKARFMKLRVKDANCYQMLLNEVVIHGYRCTQSGDTPVYFENLDYKNESDERIITLENENEITVSGKVVNNTSEDASVKVITAAYSDGALIDLDIASKNLNAFAKADISMRVDLEGAEDAEVYTFVWDNFENMNVLSPIEGFGTLNHKTASIAKSGEGASFDTESVRMTAWGTSAEKTGLCDVALLVLKSGVLNSDTIGMSDSELENAILYIEQAKPDDTGKYGFEFFPHDVSTMYGNNNVYVKEKGAEYPSYYRLLFFDGAGELAMLGEFRRACNSEDASVMRTVIDTYDYVLTGIGIIDDAVEKYGEEIVLNSVSSMLLDADFETSDDVVNEIIAAVILTDINNLETKDEVINKILNFANEMMVADNGIYNNYYAGDDNEDYREDITDNFVGQNYTSVKAFEYDICETIVLDVLNGVMNYKQVESLIDAGREFLEEQDFDYEGYDDLTPAKKKRVQQGVAASKGTYTSLESVKDKFNDKVENPGTDRSYGGSSGSSGGGGFSSGNGMPLTGVKTSDIEVFSDLGSVLWAKESILALYEKGIVSGMNGKEFAPNDNVTREQFAKMLVCAFNLYDSGAEAGFEDVETGAWYELYVASAKSAGIINGVSDELFGIGAKITRQDMAVMAYNTLLTQADKVLYDRTSIVDFTDDAEISAYAKDAVYAMRGLGIMQGRGNNAFCGKEPATRAEAAKIIHSLLGN